MSILTLFKNRYGSVSTIMKDGTRIAFVAGQYFTDVKKEYEFLKECAETKQCGVFVDKAQPEIDTENQSPIAMLKAKLREEILAELAAGGKNKIPQVSPGDSTQGTLAASAANTASTATGALKGAGDDIPQPGAGVPEVQVDGNAALKGESLAPKAPAGAGSSALAALATKK